MLSNLFFLLLFSENINNFHQKINETHFCAVSKKVSIMLDRAFIEYADMTASIYYKDTIKTLQSYLMQFYVCKSEKIELKRTKTEGPITGEYSTIKVTLYYKDGKTEVFSDTIGSQEYIIEYNPKYKSFLEFLEEIVK